jgi:hypothetical protein
MQIDRLQFDVNIKNVYELNNEKVNDYGSGVPPNEWDTFKLIDYLFSLEVNPQPDYGPVT